MIASVLRHRRTVAALLVASLALFVGPGRAQTYVDLELVLAVDVSGSVDGEEYALQMGGIAAAFRDPRVQSAIAAAAPRGIAVALVLWSSSESQVIGVDWHHIATPAQARAFAEAVESAPRGSSGNTAIASAIDYAAALFRSNGFEGSRRVIDVSGDGISNDGPDTAPASDRAVQQGITINGLVIVENNLPAKAFYRERVIGGPGAFAISARGFADFPRAFLRKLLREIHGPGLS